MVKELTLNPGLFQSAVKEVLPHHTINKNSQTSVFAIWLSELFKLVNCENLLFKHNPDTASLNLVSTFLYQHMIILKVKCENAALQVPLRFFFKILLFNLPVLSSTKLPQYGFYPGSGYRATVVDIAPSFCGILYAFSNALSSILYFVAPLITGFILEANEVRII